MRLAVLIGIHFGVGRNHCVAAANWYYHDLKRELNFEQ
jgi:hypothetical protein